MERIVDAAQLGQAIRHARRERGLNQDELAQVAGVGINFVSQIERGKETAELGKVLRLVNVLGLNLMIGGRGEWTDILRSIECEDRKRSK